MTEEEVSKQLAKMNQDIYLRKLIKDLEQSYEILTIVVNNLVVAFIKEMENHLYELSFNSDKSLTREEISIKVGDFFNKIKDYCQKKINENKDILIDVINNNDNMKYLNQIEMLSRELVDSLSELYLNESQGLISEISDGYDEFTKKRINNIVRDIFYNQFIVRIKSAISNANLILINNYSVNNEYLNHLNEKTVK